MMIKLKDRAYKKCRSTRADNDYAFYKDLRNYITLAVRNEKAAFFRYNIKRFGNNSKKLWNFFSNNSVHCKPRGVIEDDIADPNLINSHFLESVPDLQISDLHMRLFSSARYPLLTDDFDFKLVSPGEVEVALRSLRSDACGCDGISLRMLRCLMPFCSEIVTDMINMSLSSGTVPLSWKRAIVVPLSKVPRAVELSDLRPISILPAISKLLERIVFKQLVHHLSENNILPSLQSGFRKHYSTATALSRVTNDIARAADSSMVTFLVLLDFSKAFDIINHDLLVSKLVYYGCSGSALRWFVSYLDCRVQQVRLLNVLSSVLPVTRGVPQGSILGPVLFSIFTTDISNVILGSNYHLYADDTQVYISCRPADVDDAISDLNLDLARVYSWACDNGLMLNPQKTVAVCIGSAVLRAHAISEMTHQLELSGRLIPLSPHSRNLGLTFDQHFSFEPHVNKKLSLCYFKLKTLYKFKCLLPPNVKWNLCSALILSQIDYCGVVYFNFLTKELKNRLQVLQNCCFRFSYSISRYDHITPYYNANNILKLEHRNTLLFATFLYNVVRSGLPEYLCGLLVYRSDIHDRNLRNLSYLTVPKHNTTKFEGCFEHNASKVYNQFIFLFEGALTVQSLRFKLRQVLLQIQSGG